MSGKKEQSGEEIFSDSQIKLDPYLAAAGSDRRSIYIYREDDYLDSNYEYAFELSVLKGQLLSLKGKICTDEITSVSDNRAEDIEQLDQRLTYIDNYFSNKTDGQMPSNELAHLTWEQQARILGERFFNQNNRLTVLKISKLVEEEFERVGVKGRGGIVISAETIKRHALSGITQKKDKKN